MEKISPYHPHLYAPFVQGRKSLEEIEKLVNLSLKILGSKYSVEEIRPDEFEQWDYEIVINCNYSIMVNTQTVVYKTLVRERKEVRPTYQFIIWDECGDPWHEGEVQDTLEEAVFDLDTFERKQDYYNGFQVEAMYEEEAWQKANEEEIKKAIKKV